MSTDVVCYPTECMIVSSNSCKWSLKCFPLNDASKYSCLFFRAYCILTKSLYKIFLNHFHLYLCYVSNTHKNIQYKKSILISICCMAFQMESVNDNCWLLLSSSDWYYDTMILWYNDSTAKEGKLNWYVRPWKMVLLHPLQCLIREGYVLGL